MCVKGPEMVMALNPEEERMFYTSFTGLFLLFVLARDSGREQTLFKN